MVSRCVCQSAPVRALVVPVCCERGLYFKNSSLAPLPVPWSCRCFAPIVWMARDQLLGSLLSENFFGHKISFKIISLILYFGNRAAPPPDRAISFRCSFVLFRRWLVGWLGAERGEIRGHRHRRARWSIHSGRRRGHSGRCGACPRLSGEARDRLDARWVASSPISSTHTQSFPPVYGSTCSV